MKLEVLEKCFEVAKKKGARYVAVTIETRGSEGEEIIINPSCNFDEKLAYYKKAYNEDLVLKTYDGIRITRCTYGGALSTIQRNLEYFM